MFMAFARFNAANPEFFRFLIIESQAKTERSERLAGHLRRAVAVFANITGQVKDMPVRDAIRAFQLIGAAGSLFALSAHSELMFGGLLHDAEFVDEFADSPAALALSRPDHDRESRRFSVARVTLRSSSRRRSRQPRARCAGGLRPRWPTPRSMPCEET